MKQLLVLVVLVLSIAVTAGAQMGRSVPVAAGTDEDKALLEIYSAPDGPAKIALLDKFMADFGKGDFELLGDTLYVQTYLAQKNYAKEYEFGDKALALDPDNLTTVVNMTRAAEAEGNTEKLFANGEKAAAIIERYKSSPPPEGVTADQWTST